MSLSDGFDADPKWDARDNRKSYRTSNVRPRFDFGYSPTRFAGGTTDGEIGGLFFRGDCRYPARMAYYADRVGPLTLDDRLEARGKVVLKVGAPDSDVYLGWFLSAHKEKPPAESGNFLGVHVGGPTRVGHYFVPRLATARATTGKIEKGPVLTPGRVFDWSLVYDPAANGGQGEVRVTLG